MKATAVMQSLEKFFSQRAVMWSVAIALGLMSAMAGRFVMNPDGITYMNLATFYQRGDWASAINGYWSPLYPLLIAATFRIAPTSQYFESTIVHGLNFVLYLGAFAGFRFFLGELRQSQERERGAHDEVERLSFRPAVEAACAYSLFFWAALTLIGLALVTPDMALAVLVFVAAGVTIRLRRSRSLVGYLGLGAIIGLAYLTKAVMFPLGIVMCLCCGLPASVSTAVRRSVMAFAGFLFIASPQIYVMSRLAGHFSYGESGTVAYATEVNHISKMWVGEPPGSGTPVHPVHRLLKDPPAYEFSLPNTTLSYPVSDETAYLMAGVRPHFSIIRQLRVTNPMISWYVTVFDVLIVTVLALYILKKRVSGYYLALIVPAIATFTIYALVYSETRYLAASTVILFLCLAGSIQFGRDSMRGTSALMGALALYYGASTLNVTRNELLASIRLARQQSPNTQFETAVELSRLGIKTGSRVGAIGYAFNSYWARLAGVQIAMQVPNDTAYALASDSAKDAVIRSFRDSGAVAVVYTGVPKARAGENWQRLGPAGYWIMLLSPGQPGPSKAF